MAIDNIGVLTPKDATFNEVFHRLKVLPSGLSEVISSYESLSVEHGDEIVAFGFLERTWNRLGELSDETCDLEDFNWWEWELVSAFLKDGFNILPQKATARLIDALLKISQSNNFDVPEIGVFKLGQGRPRKSINQSYAEKRQFLDCLKEGKSKNQCYSEVAETHHKSKDSIRRDIERKVKSESWFKEVVDNAILSGKNTE